MMGWVCRRSSLLERRPEKFFEHATSIAAHFVAFAARSHGYLAGLGLALPTTSKNRHLVPVARRFSRRLVPWLSTVHCAILGAQLGRQP
jgi:hypothetical protein